MTHDARCTCMEIAGEDPRCKLHGWTLEKLAAWTDTECDFEEIDPYTLRQFARDLLAMKEASKPAVEGESPHELVQAWQAAREEWFKRDVEAIVEDFAEWMTERARPTSKGEG